VADTFTPDIGQRIDPAGRVTYDFDAHIHARGLDLDAGTGASAPADRRVRWLRTNDGAMMASLYGTELGSLFAESYAPTSGLQSARTQINANAGARRASIEANADATFGFANVAANAGSAGAILLTDTGASEFVRGDGIGAMRLHGIYTIDSGPLDPGDLSVANLFHNLGQPVYPAGELRDLGFACDIGRAFARTSANQLDIAFRNLGAVFGARAELNLFLLTLA
jgi:hypothetical protein